jgi:hypothetical protein
MEVGIVFYFIRQFGCGYHVGDGQSATRPEHPVGFAENLSFVG